MFQSAVNLVKYIFSNPTNTKNYDDIKVHANDILKNLKPPANILATTKIRKNTAFEIKRTQELNAFPFSGSPNAHLATSSILGHLLGDSFISKTPLEGYEVVKIIDYLIPILKSYLNKCPDPKLKNITASLSNTQELYENLSTWISTAGDLNTLLQRSSDIEKKEIATKFFTKFNSSMQLIPLAIQNLQASEQLTLPGGWNNHSGGHALLYIIEKSNDGSYMFSVVNTGAGLEYHESAFIKGDLKHNPILTIHHIDADIITHPDFCSSLLNCLIPLSLDGNKSTNSAKELYDRILPALQGEVKKRPPKQHLWIKEQKSGTCTSQVWMAWIRHVMSHIPNYKRLMLHIKGQALYDSYLQSKSVDKPDTIILLRRSAEKYASYLYKIFLDGLCDKSTLLLLKALPEKVLADLSSKKVQPTEEIKNISTETIDVLVPPVNISTIIAQKKITLKEDLFPEIKIHSVRDIIPQLERLLASVHKMEKQGLAQNAVDIIEDGMVKFVLAMDSEQFRNDLIKQCKPEFIHQCLSLIDKTRESLLKNFLALPIDSRNTLEYSCVSKYLQMLFYHLSNSLPEGENFLHFTLASKEYIGLEELVLSNELAWISNPTKREALQALYNFNKLMRSSKPPHYHLPSHSEMFYFCPEYYPILLLNDDHELIESEKTVIWKKILKDGTILQKLHQDYPLLNKASDNEILKVLFTDLEGKYLPYNFCLMRKLFFTDFFVTNSASIQFSKDHLSSQNCGKLSLTSIAIDPTLTFKLTIEESTKKDAKQPKLREPKIKTFPFSNKKLIEIQNVTSRLTSNCIVKWSALSNEQAIDKDDPLLAMIGSCPKTIVVQVMDYIKSHHSFVADLEYQQFFLTKLFYKSRIDKNLKSSPELRQSWVNFLNDEFQTAWELEEISQALFYLYLLRMTPGTECRGKAIFHLRAMKKKAFNNLELQAKISGYLIAALGDQDPFSSENALEVIANAVLIKACSTNTIYSESLDLEIDKAIRKARSHLTSINTGDKLLAVKQIYEDCFPTLSKDNQWESIDPYLFKIKDMDVYINLHETSLQVNGEILGNLPDHIVKHEDFLRVLGQNTVTKCTRRAQNQIHCITVNPSTSQEVLLELTFDQHSKLTIRKKMEGGDYLTYIPPSEVSTYKILTPFVKNNTHWMCISNGKPILFIKNKDDKIIAKAHSGDNQGSLIVKSHPEGLTLKNVALCLQQSPYSTLKAIKAADDMLIWGNDKIEIPEIGLDFIQKQRSNPTELVWEKDPNYIVLKQQLPPKTLPYLDRYVRLGNGVKTKIIIPRLPIDLIQKKSGALDPCHRFNSKGAKNKLKKHYAFDVNPNDVLEARNVEEALFLAYLHLVEKNYRQAEIYLSELYPIPPKGLTLDQLEVIEWILKYIDYVKDPSTEVSIIFLKLYYLISKNDKNPLFKALPTDEIELHLNNCYRQWMHALKKLTPSEELFYKQIIPFPLYPAIQARWRTNHGTCINPAKFRAAPNLCLDRLCNYSKLEENIFYQLDLKKYPHPGLMRLSDVIYKYPELLKNTLNPLTKKTVSMQLRLLENTVSDSFVTVMLLSQLSYLVEQQDPELIKTLLPLSQNLHLAYSTNDHKALYDAADRIQKCCVKHQKTNVIAHPTSNSSSSWNLKQGEALEIKPNRFFQNLLQIHPIASHDELRPIFDEKTIPACPLKLLQDKQINFSKKYPFAQEEVEIDLIQAFTPPENCSRILKREFNRMKEEILEAHKKRKETAVYSPDKPWASVLIAVNQIQSHLKQQNQALEKQILELGNSLPKKQIEKAKQELALMAKHTKPLTIDEIIIFCMQRNAEALEKRNPALDETYRASLAKKVSLFLLQSTRCQRFTRAIKIIEDSINNKDPDEKIELEQLAAEELALPELLKPNDFEMLAFSYYADVRLWELQVSLIKELCADVKNLKKINKIVQLIMGSGKSKVILPLLALLLSNGIKIPVIVVPDELFEGNNIDLKTFSGDYLGQEVETFYINKLKTICEQDLDDLALKIHAVKMNRSYLMTNPWSIYQLILLNKRLRENLSISHDLNLERQQQKVTRILLVLKEQGIAVLDEADSILDILKEVNASIGETEKVSKHIQKFMMDIFIHLNENNEFADYFSIASKTEAIFSDEDYVVKIKPKLASWVINWINTTKYLTHSLSVTEQRELAEFLLKKNSLKNIPLFLTKQIAEVQELFSIIQLTLNELFPAVLRKNQHQHYGLSKQNPSFVCIPYNELTKEPKENSEFSLVAETMLYSMLYISKEGVNITLLEKLVNQLKNAAIEESNNLDVSPNQTQAYQKYQSYQLTPTKTLFNVKKTDLELAVIRIHKDPRLKMRFAKDFALKEISFYKESFNANPNHLVNVFGGTIGFTGAIWNQDSFPSNILGNSKKGIDGKTTLAINRKKPNVHIFAHPKSFKEDPIFKSLTGYNALVNAGAWFLGVSNTAVAEQILISLNSSSQIKSVAYVNDQDTPPGSIGTFVILEKGKKAPVLLNEAENNNPHERFTYYHIGTGLDLSQIPQAKALVTVDQNMITRDNLQGARRMRKLDFGHRVDYAIREKTAKHIGAYTYNDLVRYFTIQQGNRQEMHNNRGMFAEINYQLEHYLDTFLKTSPLKKSEKNELYKILRPLLVKINQQFILSLENEVSPDKFVKSYIEHLTPYFDKLPELKKLNVINKFWSMVPTSDPSTGLDRFEKAISLFIQGKIQSGAIENKIKMHLIKLGISQQTQTQNQTETQTQAQSQNDIDDNDRLKWCTKNPKNWDFRNASGANLFRREFFNSRDYIPIDSCTVSEYLIAHQKSFAPLKNIEGLDQFFCSNLRLTQNYRDVYSSSQGLGEELVKPFGRGFKPTMLSLLVENKNPGAHLEFYYLHPDEASFLIKLLSMDRTVDFDNDLLPDTIKLGKEEEEDVRLLKTLFSKKNSDCRIALVHPEFGILHQGREPIKTDLETNAEYIQFTTESKVWDGKLHFTCKEMEHLKSWISRVGPNNFENMLLNVILRIKPEAYRKYQGSSLQRTILELKNKLSSHSIK